MRSRLVFGFGATIALNSFIACSLITDYALESKSRTSDGGTITDASIDDADGGSLVDAPVDVDAGGGFVCTETPCIVELGAAERDTCARTGTGDVYCWGSAGAGIPGRPTNADWGTPNKVAFAGPVDGISVGGGGRWSTTACARRGASIDCWGADDAKNRKLGRGNVATPGDFNPTPGPVVSVPGSASDLGVGSERVCAVFGGALSCWGRTYDDQVQYVPTAFAAPAPIKRVYGGRNYHCALLDTGQIACAGYLLTFKPYLGDGGPPPGQAAMMVVPGYANVVDLAAKGGHICALTTSGTVLCSGRNDKGQLGRGGTSGPDTNPLSVALPLPGVVKLIGGGLNHTCAVLTDDSLWCWGRNDSGNNYDKTATARGQVGPPPDGGALDAVVSSPRRVLGLPSGPIRQVVGGYEHTCALMGSGAVYCWGGNRHGQLGLGKSTGSNGGDGNAHPNPVRVLF